MNKKIRIAVVGLGRAGHFHLTAIKHLEAFELCYVYDVDKALAATVADLYKCAVANSYETLLEDEELEAIVIASPTDAHYDYIRLALQGGKHVFTEKPVGHSTEEIQNCYSLSRAHNKSLHLGFQRRLDKNFAALKAQLPELGDFRIVKASSRDNPKPSYAYLEISGNIFHDMLIHDFDMLMFLFGPKVPQTVFATGHAYDKTIEGFSDYDTVLVSIKYEDGLVCAIDTSRISAYGYDQRIEVFGEKGMLTVENEKNNTLHFYNEMGMHQSPFNHSFPERYKDAYMEELRQFSIAIKAGELSNIVEEESVLAHQLADAALHSIQTGGAVDFKAFIC